MAQTGVGIIYFRFNFFFFFLYNFLVRKINGACKEWRESRLDSN